MAQTLRQYLQASASDAVPDVSSGSMTAHHACLNRASLPATIVAVAYVQVPQGCGPPKLQPVAQALSSPISGVLGDKYDRTSIISLGAFLWGTMTFAIGLSTSIHQVLM